MSGHSKWSKIKRQKGKEDKKRGAEFSRLSRAVRVAVVKGGSGDYKKNATLRMAVDKARASNMPKANIDRAIKNATGNGDNRELKQVTFEGYGPAGVGLMVDVETDNKNRTTAEIKNIFEKNGGSLSGPGSVAFLFEKSEGKLVAKSKISVSENEMGRVKNLLELLKSHADVVRVVHVGDLV